MDPLDLPCLEYQGLRHEYGYGYPPLGAQRYKPSGAKNGRHQVLLHRWIMEQVLGRPLRDDEVVRHRCDNPPCFRYVHLELGSQDDNAADMVNRGRSRRGAQHWNWKGGKSRNYREGRNRRKGATMRPKRSSKAQRAIIAVLRADDVPSNGLAPQEIRSATKLPATRLYQALGELHKEGTLVPSGTGRGNLRYRLAPR